MKNNISNTITPSMERGIKITPRAPDFKFDKNSIPKLWFSGNTGITTAWNALSIMVGGAEIRLVKTGKWLIDRIDDEELAKETQSFVQQEAFHSMIHAKFDRVLIAQGLPVKIYHEYCSEILSYIEEISGHSMVSATSLAFEQAIGELGHTILENPEVFDNASEPLRKLLMWHAFEEVEHQAGLHDAWTYVHGQSKDARNLRVVGAIYLISVLVIVWPIGIWAMHPKESNHKRLSLKFWKPLIQQLFGSKGLMRGSAKNLWNLIRKDFHPFDMYDPIPILNHWRSKLTKPEWEKSFKLKDYGKNKGDVKIISIGLSDINKFSRFQWTVLLRTKKFISEVRFSRNNIAKA